jgi:ParB-like chromosome segregation protein Spo0J
VTSDTLVHVEIEELGEELGYLRLSTPELQRDVEKSLARHGQLTPILAWRGTGGLQVVNGFKRLHGARALGWTHLWTQAWDGEDFNPKHLLWQCNQGHALTELEEGWVVRALYREDHLTQPRIAQLFGRNKSWVCRRLMLAEGLADQVQSDVRLGLLSPTAAREIGRLPRGNQGEVSQLISRRALTTRQSARLVDELLAAPDEAQKRRVLEAAAQGPVGHGEGRPCRRTPGEWLVWDVATATRICTRLNARLLERSLRSFGTDAAEVAAEGLRALRSGLSVLEKTIEEQLRRREA